MERFELFCPFCLENTKRWKIWEVVWVKYSIETYDAHGKLAFVIERKAHGLKKERDAREWERKVLQEHLPTCALKDRVSDEALKMYNLVRPNAGVA